MTRFESMHTRDGRRKCAANVPRPESSRWAKLFPSIPRDREGRSQPSTERSSLFTATRGPTSDCIVRITGGELARKCDTAET
jgi:hypothetical protein